MNHLDILIFILRAVLVLLVISIAARVAARIVRYPATGRNKLRFLAVVRSTICVAGSVLFFTVKSIPLYFDLLVLVISLSLLLLDLSL